MKHLTRRSFSHARAAIAPQDVIDKLNGAINKSIVSPKFKAALKANGIIPVGGAPGDLAKMVAGDTAI